MVIAMLYKNTLLKIKKSFGRYLSLLIIVFVGVGFYAGIQITAPDITNVADSYYQENKLMDFKIVSSMGLTGDDTNALKQLNGVAAVVGSYSLDVQSRGSAIRIHAIEDQVNTVRLTDGKMPGSDTECVADSRTYQIGDKIEITDDTHEKIKNTEFTVVGLVDSVLYLQDDYGSTTIGNGKLSSFIFINKDNFILEAFTEIYVMAQADHAAAYGSEYKHLAALLNDALVKIKPDRENARFDEIYNEAQVTIRENETELNSEKTKGVRELDDAKKELDENARKLQDGKNEIAENEAKLTDTVRTQNAEFNSSKKKITEGWEKINTALSDAGITKGEISANIDELDLAITNMKLQLNSLPANTPLKQLKLSADTLTEQEKKLNDGITAFNTEIEKAKSEIESAKQDIADGEKELNDGYDEYNTSLAKFSAEIADAETKISDAKAKLSDIERPKWYIFDRGAAAGYNELDGNVGVVTAVSNILPLFFVLIAMLMTSNSMARMITEERGELGTLTSLGYKDRSIIFTYLLYVLSASGLGGVIGFFVGCRFIPPLIYNNFTFRLPPLVIEYNMITFGIILAVTFALMTAITVIACHRELKQKPAALMRPLPPKHGQKILLERIGLIWRRLSFTWKVTVRNMFRYKKRAFMTIVGVAGCTALLLIAFGLHDSMGSVATKQYGDILRYDSMIILKDEVTEISGELKELFEKEQITNPLLFRQAAYKCEQDGNSLDLFLVVPQSEVLFHEYYGLESTLNNKNIHLDGSGVVVTQRLAKIYKLKKGDTITVKDTDNNSYDLAVSDVAENYASNYIFMNPSVFGKVFDETAAFNAIVSSSNNEDEASLAERLIDSGLVANVTFTSDAMEIVNNSTRSLNGVILLIVAVASLLAVVVLYNLTAINISERTREIATLKVLGFRDGETNAYIYREALLLTVISIGIGMGLGLGLHRLVLDIIETGALSLPIRIKWYSYILSAALTMVFSVFMQIVTYFKLKKIDMIESLKSVE